MADFGPTSWVERIATGPSPVVADDERHAAAAALVGAAVRVGASIDELRLVLDVAGVA